MRCKECVRRRLPWMNEGSKSSGCGVFAVRTDMLFYPFQAFKFMSFFLGNQTAELYLHLVIPKKGPS